MFIIIGTMKGTKIKVIIRQKVNCQEKCVKALTTTLLVIHDSSFFFTKSFRMIKIKIQKFSIMLMI